MFLPMVCALVSAACGAEAQPDAERRPDPSGEADAGSDQASVVMSGTFERPSPVCNDWRTTGSSGLRAIPPRSGDYACRVCSNGFLSTIGLTQATGPLDAGSYRLSAWVRSRSDLAAPREMVASVSAQVDGEVHVVSATAPVLDEWREVQVPVELRAGADDVRVSFDASASRAECMFIDDVIFERLPR